MRLVGVLARVMRGLVSRAPGSDIMGRLVTDLRVVIPGGNITACQSWRELEMQYICSHVTPTWAFGTFPQSTRFVSFVCGIATDIVARSIALGAKACVTLLNAGKGSSFDSHSVVNRRRTVLCAHVRHL